MHRTIRELIAVTGLWVVTAAVGAPEPLKAPPQDQGLPYTRSARPFALAQIKDHIARKNQADSLRFINAAAKQAQSIEDLRRTPALDLIALDPAVPTFTRNCLGGGVNVDGWSFPLKYPEALVR